jgi:hypothetical protein
MDLQKARNTSSSCATVSFSRALLNGVVSRVKKLVYIDDTVTSSEHVKAETTQFEAYSKFQYKFEVVE